MGSATELLSAVYCSFFSRFFVPNKPESERILPCASSSLPNPIIPFPPLLSRLPDREWKASSQKADYFASRNSYSILRGICFWRMCVKMILFAEQVFLLHFFVCCLIGALTLTPASEHFIPKMGKVKRRRRSYFLARGRKRA